MREIVGAPGITGGERDAGRCAQSPVQATILEPRGESRFYRGLGERRRSGDVAGRERILRASSGELSAAATGDQVELVEERFVGRQTGPPTHVALEEPNEHEHRD